MGFLKHAFVGLLGLSVFSAGAGWVFFLLSADIDDGAGGLAAKGVFVPMALFIALVGGWMIFQAFGASKTQDSDSSA